MEVHTVWTSDIDCHPEQPIVIETTNAKLSGDAGLLPFLQLDERLGLTVAFASVLNDSRDPNHITHSLLDLVRFRVFAILAGYEDQIDAATLRNDPIFKLILGRNLDDAAIPSQPTLSRFENSITPASLKSLRELFVQQFLDSFSQAPTRLTFDLDAVDDPAHGRQQLTFWHNYYDQNQYYPLIITCAENDLIAMLSLRHGTAHASLGADADLEYLIERIRRRWPDVVIHIRGDCAFGIPDLYELCDRLQLRYIFGLTGNVVLLRQSQTLYEQVLADWEQERQQAAQQERAARPIRLFNGFWYQAGTWDRPRWVVVKAEVNEQGSQRRFVVTNREGAQLYPGACYDEYCLRGESENRHKEFKCDLHMDRLSLHRFMANYFRLYLHGLAMNLVVRMRGLVALPVEQSDQQEVPVDALPEQERKKQQQQQRQRDAFGQAQPNTWRRLVIKVAACVRQTSKRIVVQISDTWGGLDQFSQFFRLFKQRLSELYPITV